MVHLVKRLYSDGNERKEVINISTDIAVPVTHFFCTSVFLGLPDFLQIKEREKIHSSKRFNFIIIKTEGFCFKFKWNKGFFTKNVLCGNQQS